MLISFIITSILSSSLILLLIQYAPALGLVAVPNERSAHKDVTPCSAGIAFIGAMFIGTMISGWEIYSSHWLSVVAIFLVFLLGVYDDYRHSSSYSKFFLILVAGVLVCFDGMRIHSIGVYFNTDISLHWLAIPVTLFAIAGFTNALNLIDGLDGLAGGVSLIILAGLEYVGYINQDPFLINIISVLFPALLAFIVFNWNPAKVFMGDSGSLTLGFIIAVLSIKALDYIDPISILFIAALPVLDTVTVMIRRKRNGLSLFSADKNHLHHILLDKFGGNVKVTVLVLVGFQLVFTLFGIFISSKMGQEITLPLFLACLIVLYVWVDVITVKVRRIA